MNINEIVNEPICTCQNIELQVPVSTGMKKFIIEGKKDGKCPIHHDHLFSKKDVQTEEPFGI